MSSIMPTERLAPQGIHSLPVLLWAILAPLLAHRSLAQWLGPARLRLRLQRYTWSRRLHHRGPAYTRHPRRREQAAASARMRPFHPCEVLAVARPAIRRRQRAKLSRAMRHAALSSNAGDDSSRTATTARSLRRMKAKKVRTATMMRPTVATKSHGPTCGAGVPSAIAAAKAVQGDVLAVGAMAFVIGAPWSSLVSSASWPLRGSLTPRTSIKPQ